MDRPIVVGVDGSPGARAALVWALKEARLRHCRVDTVSVARHAWAAWVRGVEPSLLPEFQADQVMARLDQALWGEAPPPSATLEAAFTESSPAEVLVAASRRACLVVVGAHVAHPGPQRLARSVALEVARHAHCPVAVVPAGWGR